MGPNGATVLSAATEVQGDLRAGEDLRIEGVVRGRVVSDHEVVVAPGAVVEGELQARRVRVEGYVGADVQAHERLTVTATGQVLGDVRARELSLAPGGRVRGRVETGGDVPLTRWNQTERSAHRPRHAHQEPGWTAPAPRRPEAPRHTVAPAAAPLPRPGVERGDRAREEVVESSPPARGEIVEVDPVPAAETQR